MSNLLRQLTPYLKIRGNDIGKTAVYFSDKQRALQKTKRVLMNIDKIGYLVKIIRGKINNPEAEALSI